MLTTNKKTPQPNCVLQFQMIMSLQKTHALSWAYKKRLNQNIPNKDQIYSALCLLRSEGNCSIQCQSCFDKHIICGK